MKDLELALVEQEKRRESLQSATKRLQFELNQVIVATHECNGAIAVIKSLLDKVLARPTIGADDTAGDK